MKIKLSWIFFIPIFIAVAVLRIAQPVFQSQGQSTFGLTGVSVAYTSAVLAAALLVICGFLSLIDKKTSGIYISGKNPVSGILSYLIAVALSADCATSVINCLSSGDFQVLGVIDILLLVIAAVAFIVIGTGFLKGKNYTMGMSVLILMPAVWCCVRTFKIFWGYTTYSVTSIDMTDLIAYILLTFYFFFMASVLAVMSGKNPVKSCFVYGLPAMVMLFGCCMSKITYIALGMSEIKSIFDVEFLEFLLFALLILSNLVTITRKAKTIEENKGLLQQLEEENAQYDESYADDEFEDINKQSKKPTNTSSDFDDDYIFFTSENNQEVEKATKARTEKTRKEDFVRTSVEQDFVKEEEQPAEKQDEEPVYAQGDKAETVQEPVSSERKAESPLEQRMSEIDRLIMEIENSSRN